MEIFAAGQKTPGRSMALICRVHAPPPAAAADGGDGRQRNHRPLYGSQNHNVLHSDKKKDFKFKSFQFGHHPAEGAAGHPYAEPLIQKQRWRKPYQNGKEKRWNKARFCLKYKYSTISFRFTCCYIL